MRNWLGETRRQETERRLKAAETHLQNLEERYTVLENAYLRANPAPPNPPEDGDAPRDALGPVPRVAPGDHIVGRPTFPDED